MTLLRFPFAFLLLFFLLSLAAALSRHDREERHPDVFQFPYLGRGDADHSFMHPYMPSAAGDPVNAWYQVGTATVSRSRSGRDVVRLTSASQANQGLLYNAIRMESNNFNGYIDVQMDSARESHESADGMGLFFTRERPTIGSAMGISHTYQGLGIIIDTFSNSRTRRVPYVYAYVSDGKKEWNPDTDGSDTELTRGCQIEMNTPVRLYVQYVDEELHIGVAMNPRNPHRWHTCFKASGVRLPFTGGGYLAFAGETGHFFAVHEVHDAVFVDESEHGGHYHHPSELERNDYSAGVSHRHNDEHYEHDQDHYNHHDDHGSHHDHEQHEKYHDDHSHYHGDRDSHHDHEQHDEHHDDHSDYHDDRHDTSHKEPPQSQHRDSRASTSDDRGDPNTRVHAGKTASESLSGSLDLQVFDVFNTISSDIRNLGGANSKETQLRLDGVRDVTKHLVAEMEKQKADLSGVISTLRHLKETSGQLTYSSDRFKQQLRTLHGTLKDLHEKTEVVADSHDDLHSDLQTHHKKMLKAEASKGNGMLIMFLVVQLLLVAGLVAMSKLNMSSRKAGRMV